MAAPINEDSYKAKRQRTSHKKWTEEEHQIILDYLQETINLGLAIEKPNAKIYYTIMIEEKKLEDCSHTLLQNKVRNMQTKYKEALMWQGQSGQAVLEAEGEANYQAILKRKFPHIEQYKSIWGDKFIVYVPFKNTSSQIGPRDGVKVEETPNHVEVLIEDDFPEVNGNSNSDSDISTTMEQNDMVETQSIDIEQNDTVEESQEMGTGARSNSPQQHGPLKRIINKRNGSARSAYVQAASSRDKVKDKTLEFMREKIDIKRQKFEMGREIKTKRLELKREKFTHQNAILIKSRNKEFELESKRMELERQRLVVRRLEIETNRDIRLMELQIEKMQWEAKLKAQNNKG